MRWPWRIPDRRLLVLSLGDNPIDKFFLLDWRENFRNPPSLFILIWYLEPPHFNASFVSIMKITAWDRVCSFGGLSFGGSSWDVERIEYL
jgi:hypothetical protein